MTVKNKKMGQGRGHVGMLRCVLFILCLRWLLNQGEMSHRKLDAFGGRKLSELVIFRSQQYITGA